jgi:DNA-binding response OmpR family regulator
LESLEGQAKAMTATERVILIGEPDQATAQLYGRFLREAFDVVGASDEDSLLHALHSRAIDVLVLEPALLGRSTCEDLLAISRECAARGIPLVICSTQDERRRGADLGAAAYLVKPTLPATLLDTLRQVIGDQGS